MSDDEVCAHLAQRPTAFNHDVRAVWCGCAAVAELLDQLERQRATGAFIPIHCGGNEDEIRSQKGLDLKVRWWSPMAASSPSLGAHAQVWAHRNQVFPFFSCFLPTCGIGMAAASSITSNSACDKSLASCGSIY